MKNLISPIVISFLYVFSAVGQNPLMSRYAENLEYLVNNYPHTKVFVHTDKPYYTVGEDLWFAVYAMNASDHQSNPVSNVIYIVLEDEEGREVSFQSLKLEGKFTHGDIAIDPDWPEGIYTLKAYTAYMKNYDYEYIFSKEIAIWSITEEKFAVSEITNNKEKIRFFPEGGQLVNGLISRVAFEVSDHRIQEINILNSEHNIVAVGKTVSDGMGLFNLLPISGEEYFVEIEGSKFPLPNIKSAGFSFNINTLGDETIYAEILCSKDRDLSETFIIGHVRGKVYLLKDDMTGQKATLKIDKASIPEGVSQFTLFDQKGHPLAERTFFVDYPVESVKVDVISPFLYFNQRQEVNLSVQLNGPDGNFTDGNFSVSIVDHEKVTGMEDGINIKNYLLLASEFTSGIPNISTYFKEKSRMSRFMIDVLMMTRGWTRFTWEDAMNRKEPKIAHAPEDGFTISGRVLKDGDPVKAIVDVTVLGDDFFTLSMETDNRGLFTVFGLDIPASSKVTISASTTNKKQKRVTRNLSVSIDDFHPPSLEIMHKAPYNGPKKNDLNDYINTAYQIQTLDSMFDGMSVQLDELSITASKKKSLDQKIKKERNIAYSNYDRRVFLDSTANQTSVRSIFDIVRDRVPGVTVVGPPGGQRFRLRGGSNTILGDLDAMVLLDGVPASYEIINTIPVEMIGFVDVLSGLSSTTVYNAPNGIVAIYTKRPGDQGYGSGFIQSDNIANVLHHGYYESKEFYSPDYSTTFTDYQKPDYRTTLFWKPRVTTNEGKANLNFYGADITTDYLVEIQGLTTDGIPFVHYSTFEVR